MFELVEIALSVFYGFECQRNKAFLIQPSKPSGVHWNPKLNRSVMALLDSCFLCFKIKIYLPTLSTLFTSIVNPVLRDAFGQFPFR